MFTYLFKHSLSSWFLKQLLGNSWWQYEQSVGSSEMAFSTAKLREQTLRFISVRQFGQVDCSFFSRLSANRCVKQDAHIKCPFRHYIQKKKKKKSTWQWANLLDMLKIRYLLTLSWPNRVSCWQSLHCLELMFSL